MMPFWSWFRKFSKRWRHILRWRIRWRNHWNFSHLLGWEQHLPRTYGNPRGVQQPRVILYSSFYCQGELDQEEARIRLMGQPWGRLRLLCHCAVSVPNVLSCFVLQNFRFFAFWVASTLELEACIYDLIGMPISVLQERYFFDGL